MSNTTQKELSYEVFQAAFEPMYSQGMFQNDDDAVNRMIEALPGYNAETVKELTTGALLTLAADNADTDGFTMEDAYNALEACLRYSHDILARNQALEGNPARDENPRELANYVGETWEDLHARFENDGTLL